MKQFFFKLSLFGLVLAIPHGYLAAQSQTLASTIDVFVFPSAGQDSSRQSQDESECYQ